MGAVTLAAIKIGAIMFGLEPWVVVLGGSIVIALYSAIGGIKGVIWTDFFQFSIAMVGAVYAAFVAVSQPEIGSLSALFSHPDVADKLSFIPSFSEPSLVISMLIIPIAVQWWAVWYPGGEPGGGGYIAQRMLAAKSEEHAVGATLLFNFAHYALRPWPWIIVALASIILYPDLASIREVFPNISDQYLGEDIAYPVMLTYLSPGWLGLVTASLIAAYMSTISTHLNWGSSYLVHDVYHRFLRKDASETELVQMGRLSTVLLMALSGAFALLFLENATQAFNILLLSGAGTGGIFLLRWFWWRVNAITELVAMIFGAVLAVILVLVVPDEAMATSLLDGFTMKLLTAVTLTSVVWVVTMLVTKPESYETMRRFYEVTNPGGSGWEKLRQEAAVKGDVLPAYEETSLSQKVLMAFVGSIGVYSAMLGIGSFLYGNWGTGLVLTSLTLGAGFMIYRHFKAEKNG
jgi:Na+/proline symporter